MRYCQAAVDSSATLRITVALRRSRKTMKMRLSFPRRSGACRSPGAGARFPTQGRTEGIGPLQFVFMAMTGYQQKDERSKRSKGRKGIALLSCVQFFILKGRTRDGRGKHLPRMSDPVLRLTVQAFCC